MPQVQRRKTYALPLVPVVIVAITTSRAAAELDPMRAIAVLRIPVLGFLPFGRCCVVSFLCDLQRLCALFFGQSTELRVDRRT
ncbi:hypothetical protein Q0N25_13750, partial [Staphylococcus aureus]|nr:hypothetical protein [Staphylococcus aureus]